ncbi:Uncharacterized protein FWK35_00034072, partial [Aphis craccivora]
LTIGTLNNEGYVHMTVNHSLHFKDPDTGVHSNTIESSWRHSKASMSNYCRKKKHFMQDTWPIYNINNTEHDGHNGNEGANSDDSDDSGDEHVDEDIYGKSDELDDESEDSDGDLSTTAGTTRRFSGIVAT